MTADLGPAELVAGCALLALTTYVLLGGADFGGGIWDLLAAGPRKQQQRAREVDSSLGVRGCLSHNPRAEEAAQVADHVDEADGRGGRSSAQEFGRDWPKSRQMGVHEWTDEKDHYEYRKRTHAIQTGGKPNPDA